MKNQELIEEKIDPLLREIVKICVKNKIPYFFSMVDESSASKTTYYSSILSPKVAGVELADDRITHMLNVMNGFDTVAPNYRDFGEIENLSQFE